MRVAALSSTTFGRHCLEHGVLATKEAELVGILTTPCQINISYSPKPVDIKTHADFTDIANRSGCDVVTLTGRVTASRYLEHLVRWQPDLILILGWYFNVPRQVRVIAARGCVGLHASLLPKYRGGAPLVWAIIHGEPRTGVTLFHLEDEIDAGDIVAQQDFVLDEYDTCATAYEKATDASVKILRTALPQLADGTAPRIPQDHSAATQFPQRRPEDGLIDWDWSPQRIRNFIRSQTRPYPGAFFYAGGKKITLWDADIIEEEDRRPKTEDRRLLRCASDFSGNI